MEKELQEKYMEFQMVDQQIKQVQKQLQNVDMQLLELEANKTALNEISEVTINSEILVPVVAGVFARAKLTDNKKLIVNVGSDITVTKTVDDTVALLMGQRLELEKFREQVTQSLQALALRAKQLEQELSKMVN